MLGWLVVIHNCYGKSQIHLLSPRGAGSITIDIEAFHTSFTLNKIPRRKYLPKICPKNIPKLSEHIKKYWKKYQRIFDNMTKYQ